MILNSFLLFFIYFIVGYSFEMILNSFLLFFIYFIVGYSLQNIYNRYNISRRV